MYKLVTPQPLESTFGSLEVGEFFELADIPHIKVHWKDELSYGLNLDTHQLNVVTLSMLVRPLRRTTNVVLELSPRYTPEEQPQVARY